MPTDFQIGPLLDHVVRIDAVVLHNPLAAMIGGPEGKLRRGDEPAVHQRNLPGNADQSAPSARAYYRADLLPLEEPGKSIATRAS